jgi:hypothetical protein
LRLRKCSGLVKECDNGHYDTVLGTAYGHRNAASIPSCGISSVPARGEQFFPPADEVTRIYSTRRKSGGNSSGHDEGFSIIDAVRNLVGHRISGRRSIAASSTTNADGTRKEWREDTWALPGAAGKLRFDQGLLQRHLDDITCLLTALASAAGDFVQDHR